MSLPKKDSGNCGRIYFTGNTRQPAPADEGYDKLYNLYAMINGMKEKFTHAYNVGKKVCVDEHMVKGKRRILSNSTFP